jgi:hypothetical protein
MRRVLQLVTVGGAAYAVVRRLRSGRDSGDHASPTGPAVGRDTPTGTDAAAKYEQPGYEDKSMGQAVSDDFELVDRLVDEESGDLSSAERRFEHESAGAPALERQEHHANPTPGAAGAVSGAAGPAGPAEAERRAGTTGARAADAPSRPDGGN